MTKSQKEMLLAISAGADPNTMAQIARIQGKRAENSMSKTMLALLKKHFLQIKKGGGLEISPEGKKEAEKINMRRTELE